MKTGFRSQCVPKYRLLKEDQIKEIHRATLRLLETTGVKVMHQGALDVPGNMAFIIEIKELMTHSPKPIYCTAGGPDDLKVILDIAAAVKGGADQLKEKPFIIHYAEPISPLLHSSGAVEKLLMCAKSGVPLNYVPALLPQSSSGRGRLRVIK